MQSLLDEHGSKFQCVLTINYCGGATGNGGICAMWHEYFKTLLNFSKDIRSQQYILESIKPLKGEVHAFSAFNIKDAIKDLKGGKSAGMDG